MATKKITKTEAVQEARFTKAQILASQKYVGRRDVLGAILNEGDTYSLNEVDSLLEKFMKRKVD